MTSTIVVGLHDDVISAPLAADLSRLNQPLARLTVRFFKVYHQPVTTIPRAWRWSATRAVWLGKHPTVWPKIDLSCLPLDASH
jgi:hypothetical protein